MTNDLPAIARKIQSRQFGSAAKLALRNHRKSPGNPEFAKLAGIAQHEMGKHAEAAGNLAKALKTAPNDPIARQYLIKCYVALGQEDRASAALARWLAKAPDDAELLILRAGCHLDSGRFDRIIADTTHALRTRPGMTKARMLRAFALSETGNLQAATEDYRAALQTDPHNPEIALNLGTCLNRRQRFEDAAEVFANAIKTNPGHPELRYNLGRSLMERGAFETAKTHFREALRLYPGYFEAFQHLVELRTKDETPGLIAAAKTQLNAAPLDDNARTTLENAVGIMALDMGDGDTARTYIEQSNARRARTHPYDPQAQDHLFGHIISRFPADHERPADAVQTSPAPIFIVGLPRSGTTLTEQILSAHSDVAGLGELDTFERIAQTALAGDSAPGAAGARAYLNGLPELPAGTIAFVDKTPHNYHHVGFLLDAFPNARIVDVQRDPRAVAYSMWQRHLIGSGTYYTSRLDWIAHAANLYKRYMNHWRTLWPGQIMTVTYEKMVSDLSATSRALAAFCNLEWQDTMAHPERNNRTVRTASITQVRTEVHTGALTKWQAHADMLRPFTEILEPDLWPDISGNLLSERQGN